MSKTICSKCRFAIQDIPEMFCMYRKLHTQDGYFENCHGFYPKSVFHCLTQSPEVLAEKLVYQGFDGGFYSSIIEDGTKEFHNEPEAIAATVARLKEVAK